MLEDGDGASGAMSAGSTEGPAPRPRDDKAAAQCASRRSARHGTLILVALGALVLASTLASLMLGRYPITPIEAVGMLANLALPIDSFWTSQQETLFFQVRLPRIALALMVGCSLATAGAATRARSRTRRLPDILGASQGAAFGSRSGLLLGLGSLGISLFAFACSIGAVLLVLLIGTRARGNHLLIVVLAGVMVSSLFQAGVSYAKLIADPTDQLAAITYWLMGSLTGAKWTDMAFAAGPIAAGLVALFALRWRINVLTMGDDEASTMGVNARRVRLIVILAATLVTASSVSISGMIGWVG
ncbi:MAG: FecCD family ABC transporter permease, partial [Eggerthellaceae bacterium]